MKTCKSKNIVAVLLTFAMVLQLCLGIQADYASAAKKATLSTKKISIVVGQKKSIKLKNKKKSASYTYKSSKTKVASVSKAGKVTAKKKGSAVITVKEKVKKKLRTVGKVKVTVKNKTTSVVDTTPAITLAPATTAPTAAPTVAPTAEPTVAPTATPVPTKDPNDISDIHDDLMADSLVSTGNNARMKKVIEKAQNGEEVKIAFLGGSITEGAGAKPQKTACYAYNVYQAFKTKYAKGDGSNIKYCNAGMSGTPSSLGWIRYQRDIVDALGGEPDLLFVEFAVNDGDDETQGQCYESIVRHALTQANQPAVFLVFSVFESEFTKQDLYKPLGNNYGLPMVSMYDSVTKMIKAGKLTNAQFFASDGLHPTNLGHQIMSDSIMNCIDTAVAKDTDTMNDTLPAKATIGTDYDNMVGVFKGNIPEGITVNEGSFTENDSNVGSFYYTGGLKFPYSWSRSKDSESSDAFSITATCKNMQITFKRPQSRTFAAKADVYVDGVLATTLDSSMAGGWNNPWTVNIFSDTEVKKHTVTVKVQDSDEFKDFTILAFGVGR